MSRIKPLSSQWWQNLQPTNVEHHSQTKQTVVGWKNNLTWYKVVFQGPKQVVQTYIASPSRYWLG